MIDYDLLYESDGIFRTDIAGRRFIYRLLTLREYKVLNGLSASGVMNRQAILMEAFKRCYVGDSNLLNRKTPVGVYLTVGQMIMYFSGDCEKDTLRNDIEITRSIYPAHSVQERMRHTIFLAFSSYTIDDSEGWTRPELIRKFIIAEHALMTRGTEYNPLDISEILTPEEFKAHVDKQNTKSVKHRDIGKVDFGNAAQEQQKELGFWDKWDAVEQEEQEKKKRGLTVSQAQKLDKLKTARG